jgi:pimeloyl-ACP methyl ester carboxylesterase
VKRFAIAFLILLVLAPAASAQITIRGASKPRKDEEKTKTVYGVVQDQTGKPIVGARVLIRNVKDNISRTILTDQTGSYQLRGLAFDVDYEVRADFGGAISEVKNINALLNREDNLLNFQLNLAVGGAAGANAAADAGPELRTFDLVRLKASFEMPRGVPAPIPAVLLLHGYGENRRVWESLRSRFLERGWAVMTLDLRGHGDSTTKNQRPLQADPAWRSSPREFPLDVDPALDWLKKQTRLNSRRIVLIGYDVGANLALVSSGKFAEVRSVIAINPNPAEALEMAGSAQDFRPHTAMVVTAGAAEGDPLKAYVKGPSRYLTLPVTGGTTQALQSKELVDAMFLWINETF